MDGIGGDRADNRTFKVDFSGDGVAKLRERVNDRLKEFMGDYTDDTLVEYVIVLLKNGRSKEEARNELNVFLDDDSDSFVSWLWDHLDSNLDLYARPREPHANGIGKTKAKVEEKTGESDSLHLDSGKEKSIELSKSHHSREWKGVARVADEAPPLRSYVTKITHTREETNDNDLRAKQSSPEQRIRKKRSRPDEREKMMREAISQTASDASRRLLQFAVRDAVASPRPLNSSSEPSHKRLRSVVSTTTGDSFIEERPQRIRSVVGVPYDKTTAIKDAKIRTSRNVFDRLGPATDLSNSSNEVPEFRKTFAGDGESRVCNVGIASRDSDVDFDFGSDTEAYAGVNVMGRDMDIFHSGASTSRNKGDSSLMKKQYSVAKDADEVLHKPWQDRNKSAAGPNTNSKIVNISVNVNTWKQPQYQEPREVLEMVSQSKEKSNPTMVGDPNAKPTADRRRELQKTMPSSFGSYVAGRPMEDADSRTIFVNNVHFAATKESLSRHFNRFGEVQKVVILTDPATGQPKGSAYVEFTRQEAAEDALSLDGTSFMSRILKVMKKSSAPQEAAAATTIYPHVAPGSSPYVGAARFTRFPSARGVPSLYRPRISIKPGTRSLQWKRDAQSTTTESEGHAPFGNFASSTARSFTYVRTEPKTNVNP